MSGSTFARQIRLSFSPDALWPEIARRTAEHARGERDRLIAAGSFSRRYVTLVNGIEGAREETIRPGGAIVYQAVSLGAAVLLALDVLRRRSPVVSGDYRNSFLVAAEGGRPIPAAAFNPNLLGRDASEVYVFSPLPYSRKVDVQLVGGRKLRFSVEPGLYEDAARAVKRAYPDLDASRLYTVQHPQRERNDAGRWIEYPAVVIRARG